MKKILAIALAVLMLAGLATVAFAANSPGGTVYHKITITLSFGNGTTKTIEPQQARDGEPYTIVAPTQEGSEFDYMTIDGDYDDVARSPKTYTESSVTIIPHGDLNVMVYYKNASPVNPEDHGNTSPETGANYAMVILAICLGVFGVALSTKKLFVK